MPQSKIPDSKKFVEEDEPPLELHPAERIPIEYSGAPWRIDPATGITSDGVIYSVAYGKIFESHDQGRSWSSRDINFEGFGCSADGGLANGASGFGILPDDTFLLLYGPNPSGEKYASVIERLLHEGMAVARSGDRGKTWQPGQRLEAPPETILGSDGQKICSLPDGSVIVSSYQFYPEYNKHDLDWYPEDHYAEFVYRSLDGGKTWPERHLLMHGGAESNFLSLGNGRVLAAIRRIDPQGGQNKRMFLADSNDYGRSWENIRQLTTTIGDCPGEFVRLSDGRIAVIYIRRYPYAQVHLRARVSHDQGRTWDEQPIILSMGAGYSGSVVLPDDTIVTVCGNGPINENGHGPGPWTMQAVRWRLD